MVADALRVDPDAETHTYLVGLFERRDVHRILSTFTARERAIMCAYAHELATATEDELDDCDATRLQVLADALGVAEEALRVSRDRAFADAYRIARDLDVQDRVAAFGARRQTVVHMAAVLN